MTRDCIIYKEKLPISRLLNEVPLRKPWRKRAVWTEYSSRKSSESSQLSTNMICTYGTPRIQRVAMQMVDRADVIGLIAILKKMMSVGTLNLKHTHRRSWTFKIQQICLDYLNLCITAIILYHVTTHYSHVQFELKMTSLVIIKTLV